MNRIAFKRIALVTVALLFVPLIAMQFTDEVYWTLSDFIIAGTMIFTTGFIAGLIRIKLANSKYQYWIYALLIILFLLLWAEMAVGIFNSPIAGS